MENLEEEKPKRGEVQIDASGQDHDKFTNLAGGVEKEEKRKPGSARCQTKTKTKTFKETKENLN